MYLSKTLLVTLIIAVAMFAVLLSGGGSDVIEKLSSSNEASQRRGDDPTYAEELRTLSATLKAQTAEFEAIKRQQRVEEQRYRDQVDRLTAEQARQQQLHSEQIQDMQRRLTQDNGQRQLDTELQKLQQEQAKLKALLGSGGQNDTAATPPQTQRRSEGNTILNAEGAGEASDQEETAESSGLVVNESAMRRLRDELGLTEVADLLRSRAETSVDRDDERALESKPRHTTTRRPGAQNDYVSIKPYTQATTGRRFDATPVQQTEEQRAERDNLIPSKYPFQVKPSANGGSAIIPVYTIPDAATLVSNSTMTPLVGRVPNRGQVTDPFRFKLITGRKNLASNGHNIPGIVNAVWTGYAVGIREQSCVRAYLDTVTFTFEDGRIHTVNKGKGDESAAASVNDNLGYLTDQWGKPCIRGQYFNNAGEYLADRSFAAFLDGLANAYSRAQVTTERVGESVFQTLRDGKTYEFAIGQGVGGAAEEIAEYVRERADGAFDVVYVPPGLNVQIFVETQIPIDYDTNGRKLQYSYTRGGTYAELD